MTTDAAVAGIQRADACSAVQGSPALQKCSSHQASALGAGVSQEPEQLEECFGTLTLAVGSLFQNRLCLGVGSQDSSTLFEGIAVTA
jgi:hypothetical protein